MPEKGNFICSCYLPVRFVILILFKVQLVSLHILKIQSCLSVKAGCDGVGILVVSLVSIARTDEILGLSSANS